MLFSANIAVEQGVIVAVIVNAFLYLHASDVHQHTFNRSRVATLTPELGLQNLRACRRGSYPILERLVDLLN